MIRLAKALWACDCSAGLMVNKLAQATGFLPDYCADLCLPGESHISTPVVRQGSRRWREAVGLSVLQWTMLGTCEAASQGDEQKRKASQDWYPETHVTESQAACEVTLSCSIQTTSGAKALSQLFSAVFPPIYLVSVLKAHFFFHLLCHKELKAVSLFCVEVRSNLARSSLSSRFHFSCSAYIFHGFTGGCKS